MLYLLFGGGVGHPDVDQGVTHGSTLRNTSVRLGGPCETLGIEPGTAARKAKYVSTVLSLRPQNVFLNGEMYLPFM